MRAFSSLRRFFSDSKGNIAILFGLGIVPVIGAMGVALDYSWANQSRTQMQAALDNTGLMLAKMMPLSDGALNSKGWQIFQANMSHTQLHYQQSDLVITQTSSTVVLDVTTTYNTQLASVLKLVGMGTAFPVTSHTTVSWGNSRLRVALVLDNTGSMSTSNKIGALQTATNNLIDQLRAIVTTPGDVYISIVPFVLDVNVGGGVASWPSWVDSTFWAAAPANSTPGAGVGPGSNCPYNSNGSKGFVCTTGPANGSATTGTVPSSGTYKGYICPSVDNGQVNPLLKDVYYNGCYNSTTYTCTGAACTCTGHTSCTCNGNGSGKVCATNSGKFEHAWVANASTTWNGCVMDRGNSAAPGTSADYDQNVNAATVGVQASLFPAQQYSLCPAQQIVPLTYDWTALHTAVNNMSPNGNTNQPIGLVQGWQSLVGGGPFPTAPVMDTAHFTYNQYIILLSDGMNTQDRWYNVQTSIDSRMYNNSGGTISGSCKNIKDAGIKIYAVQVNTSGDPTSTLMQNCASDPSMFFELKTSGAIVSTFQQIGNALANLHLSQ